jgi:hypothetical protein
MKRTHEKTLRRPDGSRVRIIVEVGVGAYHNQLDYSHRVETCAKGKRTWTQPFDTDAYNYRRMGDQERERHRADSIRMVATDEEILAAKMELWQSIKPTIKQEQ